jgi:hypothetical protein
MLLKGVGIKIITVHIGSQKVSGCLSNYRYLFKRLPNKKLEAYLISLIDNYAAVNKV